MHKFSSWNKTDYLDLLVPCLKKEELEVRCPEGKTALHYAVEMASVAAVKRLVVAGADLDAVDGKGRTDAEEWQADLLDQSARDLEEPPSIMLQKQNRMA